MNRKNNMTIHLHQLGWNGRMTNNGFQKPVEQFFPLLAFENTDHRTYRRKPLFCLWPRGNVGMMLVILCKISLRCQGIGAKLGFQHQAHDAIVHRLSKPSQHLMLHTPSHFNNLRQSQHTDMTFIIGHQKNRSKPLVQQYQTVFEQSSNCRRALVATIRTLVQPSL